MFVRSEDVLYSVETLQRVEFPLSGIWYVFAPYNNNNNAFELLENNGS